MKVSRTFRLNDQTMEKLHFLKSAYNEIQSKQINSMINAKSFSTANVLEKLIEKEYQEIKEKGY